MAAVGWSQIGDLAEVRTREAISRLVELHWPDANKFWRLVSAGQIYRFRQELVPETNVVTYDSNRRIYHYGTVTGDYLFHADYPPELRHTRGVQWEREIPRDELSAETKNSLGAISTVFCVSQEASDEILSVGSASRTSRPRELFVNEGDIDAEAEVRKDTEQRALEFLQDRLSKLNWDEMQELVAGLLRAMGYKTRISPPGPDRGRDIVASPDGFGFQPPRIVVEVKHRKGTMGASEVRSFVGGLRQHDNGLYVSSGGFSREARYEADRSNQNLMLMDSDDLGKAIVDHYDRMDADTRALLPLRKIYWPV
jgi:restriction system protein